MRGWRGPFFGKPPQQINNFLVIFAAVKKIRLISPFISIFLITLLLSGSFGFTLIHHTCFHCGTDETIATISVEMAESNCHCHHAQDLVKPQGNPSHGQCDGCCSNGETDMHHNHGIAEFTVTDDCCSHEAERVVTDELLRTEVQNEIMPYFLAAYVVAVMQEATVTYTHHLGGDKPFHRGRDLTTLLCRLQS